MSEALIENKIDELYKALMAQVSCVCCYCVVVFMSIGERLICLAPYEVFITGNSVTKLLE